MGDPATSTRDNLSQPTVSLEKQFLGQHNFSVKVAQEAHSEGETNNHLIQKWFEARKWFGFEAR